MLNLTKFQSRIYFIIIFFIPFNATIPLNILGELKSEFYIYFALIGVIFFGIQTIKNNGKVLFHNSISYQLFLIFMVWVFMATLFSFPTISISFFKGKSGFLKLFLQSTMLIFFGLILVLYTYNLCVKLGIKQIFRITRQATNYSFVVVCLYALFEIPLVIFKIGQFKPFVLLLDSLLLRVHTSSLWAHGRITSITSEPPFLAIYLIFATPFLLSYYITHKNIWNHLRLIFILLLVYLSGSRTAFIIISFQILIFIYLTFQIELKNLISYRNNMLKMFFVGTLITLIPFSPLIVKKFNSVVESVFISSNNAQKTINISSYSRWGTQEASLRIFLNHPFFGVGIGQQGFYLPNHYPQWAKIFNNYEIRNWSDPDYKTWPPGFNMYTRLAAESGIIGLFLFIFANFYLYIQLIKLRKKLPEESRLILLVVQTLFIGFTINFLQIDTFRVLGYWIAIALSLTLIRISKQTHLTNE